MLLLIFFHDFTAVNFSGEEILQYLTYKPNQGEEFLASVFKE